MRQTIRKINIKDKDEILKMMKEFYSSDAVFTNGSEKIFEQDFINCINDCPFLEGYIFEKNNLILGYAMVAKSFSTEFGKKCIWLEDLYIKPQYRGLKIGTNFIQYIEKLYPNSILRLEVEKENESAVCAYKKNGFDFLPYAQMKKEL